MQSFKDKKVLIFGLGLNDGGLGMAEYFIKKGAQVTITDGKTKKELEPTLKKLRKYKEKIKLHLGKHYEKDFIENDIIVRNPAIKPGNEYLKIAQMAGKDIEMEMSFFHKHTPCPTIGVTGTRGKSTTTTLIYEILKKQFKEKVFLGGNIGKSAVRRLNKLKEDNLAVLELSSFQLESMGQNKLSPHIAVVTNIYVDHQDWHPSMQHYINTKRNIYRYQDEKDHLVLNFDNEITRKFLNDCKSNAVTYSLKTPKADYYLNENLEVYAKGKLFFKIENLKLEGKHNLENILAAIATCSIYDIKKEHILEVLQTFEGVHGRQEFVREVRGIKLYNDTTATSIEAMKAMFERFGKTHEGKIILIAGGVDKGLDYSLIKEDMHKYLKGLVLLEGSASEKILDQMKDFENKFSFYSVLGEAIQKAISIAKEGDIVILCPGASSFNMFANEFDRGKQFVEYINLLN